MTFTYTVSAADWGRIAPELVLAVTALLALLADLLLARGTTAPRGVTLQRESSGQAQGTAPRNVGAGLAPVLDFLTLPILSLVGLAGAFIATLILFSVGDHQNAFFSMIGSDLGSLYAYIIILSASILGILLSPAYLKRLNLIHQGEYYALMLLATIGMMLMAAATSFITVFLGLEMLSLALYILCGFVTRRTTSQESGMKYFLLSSFASAILLYGTALIYGATGSTTFSNISSFLYRHVVVHAGQPIPQLASHTLLIIGLGLLIVGFSFKVSAVPFQAWTPDVYVGAPAPVTAFMSVATKTAALVAFARVFDVVLFPVRNDWLPIVWAITILTIVGGNVLALAQTNLKRLLAYSSIAHAGYLLIGVVAGGTATAIGGDRAGIAAILFYLLCYTFMNLGAFGVVSLLERSDNTGNDLSDIRGLWYRRPVLAGLLALFMFALAGFPPMSGFAAKFYLFYVALQSGHPELLIIGVLASVFGMYYYLRIIASMFMEQEPAPAFAGIASTVPSVSSGSRNIIKPRGVGALPSRTGTVVAVKPTTAPSINRGATSKTAVTVETTTEVERQPSITWMTWTAIIIAAVGTLLMGTVLPFWLVDLAQKAASMM